MTEPLVRGGLIGCGFFARNHMHAWHDLPGVEIVAVCDLDRTKAEEMAALFDVADIYTDAETMLEDMALDFVDVATTPASHRAMVELVARHGKAVVCQKPIADTYADAKAMVDAAAAAHVPLVIHENFRWQAGFLRMKELIDADRIGTPKFARFSFRHGYDNYKNQPYLMTFERFALMDVGIHLYDIARHFMGNVERLSCETQRYNPKIKGEDAFSSLLRHDNGGVSIVDCSFQSTLRPEPFPETWAWIEGDTGTLELATDFTLSLHTSEGRESWNIEPPVPNWGDRPWHCVQDSVINFQRHVVDMLDGKTHAQPSGEDNLKTLALALASYEAAETGSVISMAEWTENQN